MKIEEKKFKIKKKNLIMKSQIFIVYVNMGEKSDPTKSFQNIQASLGSLWPIMNYYFFLIFHLAFPRRLRPEVWPLLRRPLRNNTSENRLNKVKILPNPNFDP